MEWNEIVSLAWNAKEILRGDFKRIDYGRIILPFIVLRRLGRLLEPTKKEVLEELEKHKGTDEKLLEKILNDVTGYEFHNKSKFDLEQLLEEPDDIHKNMKEYMRGFSKEVKEVFENFKFNNTIDELHKQGQLYNIVQHFAKAPLDKESVTHEVMGRIYEELIRKTSEATNEEAGEHFTPREVIQLMVNLIFSEDEEKLKEGGGSVSIYDPAAGTGGMLAMAKNHLHDDVNSKLKVELFGQELLPFAYAICKSDMMIKELNLENIKIGNSLTDQDGFPDDKFHYMLSNPPFGVDWGKYSTKIFAEQEKGFDGKYGAGLPRKSDGSLLFLMHMISKMKPKENGGARIAIVLNGSPLFTGEAGSGESNIRKWIIENDMLEAVIAMPDQLFYNTGIFTYLWIVTNNKPEHRKGKVQLINAVGPEFYSKMKSSLGMKRNEIEEEKNGQISKITKIFKDFEEGEFSKIYDNEYFGYTRITVERPLKRNFVVNEERIENLKQEKNFEKLPEKPLKKIPSKGQVLECLASIPTKTFKNYTEFSDKVKEVFTQKEVKLPSPLLKTIENALSERDETAEPYYEKQDDPHPVADSELRDYENIPLGKDIDEYFEEEVKKYVPDAWIDESTRDKIGYEIPFTRQFYKYTPLRPLEEINADIRKLQKEISEGLEELMNE
ncbi:N-6 DNA methylase [Nitrosopumilus sp. K4]|uniref:type I restriction-modification system subunit M n=1 Tax=Nitrosopumilus sp. K4 TaxID=2795383 RepID=UPI001BACC4A8|nr:type I restriction-modification system subunit M [Nitrosopumilus sp. K4]QUC64380.1 N-6 DNA methylase [Nitrosopumilus sp. K4]